MLPHFLDHPGSLLVRHPASKSEMCDLLRRVIVVNVEHNMLPQ